MNEETDDRVIDSPKAPLRRRLFVFVLLYALLLLLIGSFVGIQIVRSFADAAGVTLADIRSSTPLEPIRDGVVTTLILGVGGGDHEGAQLSDSIILSRYSPQSEQVSFVSLPRDLWFENIKDKINSVYTYGLQQRPEAPFQYVKDKYKEETGLTIDYVVVVDFAQFVEIIDALGGVDVVVTETLVDPRYPKAGMENATCTPFDPKYGCRYETLTIPAGTQHLSGTVALKYARSRHAEGDEGTDFARGRRQQQVIEAVKLKLVEKIRQGDMQTVLTVTRLVNSSLTRDIPQSHLVAFTRDVVVSRKVPSIRSMTLDEKLFIVPPYKQYDGKYVLIPKEGTLQELIQAQLK